MYEVFWFLEHSDLWYPNQLTNLPPAEKPSNSTTKAEEQHTHPLRYKPVI